MKKRFLVVFAVIVLAICAFFAVSASAATPTASGFCGENLKWTYEDGILEISDSGDMQNLDNWDESFSWRNYNAAITSIVVEDGVTSIGDYAFFGHYPFLESLTIGNSVTKIGQNAFYGCKRLKDLVIPEGVTNIGYGAFYHCDSLTSINIPSSVKSIEDLAFGFCSSLINVTIDNYNGALTIGKDAFPEKTVITYKIEIPNEPSIYMSGFSVRYVDYAGLRGVFTIDLTLDKGDYKLVEYGAVMAASAAMDREEITVDNNASKVTIWSEGKWLGKVLSYEDGVYTQFACTVTYKGDEATKYGTNDLYMRGYEIWKNAKTGETMVLYTDYKTDADYVGTDLYQAACVSYLANPGKDTSDFLWNTVIAPIGVKAETSVNSSLTSYIIDDSYGKYALVYRGLGVVKSYTPDEGYEISSVLLHGRGGTITVIGSPFASLGVEVKTVN